MTTLENFKGLTSAKKLLAGIATQTTSVHAVLFYGAEGSGKSTVARALAGIYLCSSPTSTGACGECKPCRSFASGNSSDFLIITPAGPSRMIKLGAITTSSKEDKDDAALPLSAFLRTGPLTSRHKVVLIDEADRMNAASANALLKTLEEPPPYGMIILTTREVGRVLPTILSRCVAVACEAPVSESGWSDMTDPTYGTDLRMDENAELFGSLRVFAHQLLDRPWTEAMVASEEFRGICAEIEKKEGISARHAYGEGLALLGRLLLRAGRLEAAQRAVEAHRRILGNGNASLTCDAFFADIMNPSS